MISSDGVVGHVVTGVTSLEAGMKVVGLTDLRAFLEMKPSFEL